MNAHDCPDPAAAQSLVEAARSGDPQAWTEVYRHYHPAVFGFLMRRTSGDRPLAEDLAQDTFVKALTGIEKFQWSGTDLGAWLLTIARNTFLDHRKRRSTSRESPTGDAVDRDCGTRVEDVIIARMEAERLWAAMGLLNSRQRSVIAMRYWEELSSQEIATRVGLRTGAVKTLAYRARTNLRRSLTPYGT
ncbi:RNA polymerase sigma-70 factor (ECF subfamily) [Kitasatospora sp. SolWspMP-SS2h]|uniref:RNA polymerase sigma factor n=1 Tax=Kitasatospora sp. SolWspMP-SS2h TaxID=1305729 RepID=UPI000DBA4A7A|nr:sigma-70 family RNA polymerase sigma factor [Kitasatospora sp. SolWspMP-SS2h]RAJ39979.1 RNA polymerase sigma-70 factor (ECF subfamily) [Kitasatospora sp. SolWspMP-SS2h]